MAKVSLGSKLYLFTKNGNQNLIITAHGERPKKDSDRAKVPSNCVLWFCSQHGKSTMIQVDDIIANPSWLKDMGFHPFIQPPPNDNVPNYLIYKYAGKHSNEYENYEDYNNWVATSSYDILSPRHRLIGSPSTLSDVFTRLAKKKLSYRNIYCSFCRS